MPEEPEEVEVPEEPIPEGPGTEGETPDEEETDTYTPPEGKKVTEVTEEPEHGTVEIKDGEVIYTPDDGYKRA